jgi:hypothetical protein
LPTAQKLCIANPRRGFQVYLISEQVTVALTSLFFEGQYGSLAKIRQREVSATTQPEHERIAELDKRPRSRAQRNTSKQNP